MYTYIKTNTSSKDRKMELYLMSVYFSQCSETCFYSTLNTGLLQKNPLLLVQNVSSLTVLPGLLTLLMEPAILYIGEWMQWMTGNA